MISYRYPLIAREGWKLIFFSVLVAILVQISMGVWFALAVWAIVGALFVTYRDPPRDVPALPLAIIAPVDGSVVAIRELDDQFIGRTATCISIKKPWYRIMSIRSPMEGKIQKQWYRKTDKQSDPNDSVNQHKFTQWVQSDEGDDVVISVQPVFAERMLRCYSQAGERIGQGQRCGSFQFGAMVDVLLPTGSDVKVKVGDHIKAGSDTIATLIH